MTTKSALRATMRSLLQALTPEHRAHASVLACERLRQQDAWRAAKSVLFYVPLRDELDLSPLLAEALVSSKTVAAPQYDPKTGVYRACQITHLTNDLTPGKFGILEPASHCSSVALNQLDLTLVPGVAFDRAGRRLGRGRGFYDRLLASVRGVTCGVGFDEQIVSQIPWEVHDVILDCILTPGCWWDCRPQRHGDDFVG